MTLHIGADSQSGLVLTAVVTVAQEADKESGKEPKKQPQGL